MNRYLVIILFAIFHFSAAPFFAQTITITATDSAKASTPPAQIQYELPYPGILPDHPLYFLKVARDRIVGFLINDPVKKAEFNLLQSDKKLFAARMLFDDDKDKLGFETLSKSNNYMHHAISEANRAKEMNRNTDGVVQKMGASLAKHREAIREIIRTDTQYKKQLEGEEKRLNEIRALYLQYFSQQGN